VTRKVRILEAPWPSRRTAIFRSTPSSSARARRSTGSLPTPRPPGSPSSSAWSSRLSFAGRSSARRTTPWPTSSGGWGLGSPFPTSVRRLPPRRWGRELQRVEVKPVAGLHVDEVGNVNLEPASNSEEHVECRVPLRAFDLGEVPERQPDAVSGVGLRPAQTPPGPLDARRHSAAEGLGAHPRDETRSSF
jgi:hypothetical protein